MARGHRHPFFDLPSVNSGESSDADSESSEYTNNTPTRPYTGPPELLRGVGVSEMDNFPYRNQYQPMAIWIYKVLAVLTWVLTVLTYLYYTCGEPVGKHPWTIFNQNNAHLTPFYLNNIIASIYWFYMFGGQIIYMWHLFANTSAHVQAAARVGSHVVLSNIAQFAFAMFFVRAQSIWAEIFLILNFLNLTLLYFRHGIHSRLIHIPAVSAPLAWTFVALFWNGAIAVNATGLPARILANVAIWGILVYGVFLLVVYKDWTMGLNLSILTAALGVGQFVIKVIAFQWIFAFVIMGILFVGTLLIAIPALFGLEFSFRRDQSVVGVDTETAPLLSED